MAVMGGLFEVGRSWSGIARSAYRSLRETVLGGARTDPAAPQLTASGGAGVVASESLRLAGGALRKAFDKLSSRTRPVYTTTLYTGLSSSAMLNGVSARVAPVQGCSILATTVAVNTRTSTVRSSSSALGLDVVSAQSASTIQSTAEMNTGVTTSYGSSSLTFRDGAQTSTSSGTLTGTYTGTGAAANATSLTVEVTQGDIIGLVGVAEGDIDFRVKDQNGTVLFTYSGQLGSGEQVYLGADIGLTISFSAGTLSTNHTSSTTVTRTPITVDGAAAFNASAATRPQFEGGAVVSAGSFTVNGTSITVAANDTINAVITTINSSAAGVTASLANDRITLTSNANSEDAIVLANDTSGFLAATKLSAATTTVGNIRDDQQVFVKTSQFNDVVDGSFVINGVSISVDKDTDSLQTLITRINNAGAGVTASYNAGTDRVVFTPNVAGATLTIGSDTSGFLAEAGIATGTEATQANADAAFNATGASAPQFDSGLSVQAGSFTVNGVSITVAANDTINTVLAKITASAAGVDATYDAATEKVTLTSRAYGSAPITVANDTSGFLAAVKLDGTASSATGANASAFDLALGQMNEYAGVQAGTLTVNGQAIAIDPATTTVNGLVAALNDLSNLTASVDEQTGAITINSALGGTMSLSDTSGMLTALGLTAGTYNGTAGETTALRTQAGTVPSNTPDVVTGIAAAVSDVNTAIGEMLAGQEENTAFRGALKEGVQALVDALERAGVQGVSVGTDGAAPVLSVDRAALERALNAVGKPAEARAAIGSAVNAFIGGLGEVSARQEAAVAEPPPRSLTIQLTSLPPLDRSAGQSRVSAARAAAKASASAYRKQTPESDPAQPRMLERDPRSAGRISDPAGWTAPVEQPGLFEGIFDRLWNRML